MQHADEAEFRKGRGFGGTGFLYNKKFTNSISQLVQYKHERVSVLKISDIDGDIILINGYLPYYKPSDMQNQTDLYQDTLAYIENVIIENRSCQFILLLDMNCNLYNPTNTYAKLLRDLMRRCSLISAFDLLPNFDPSNNYTRCNVKTNSYTLIDGILLSQSLSNIITDVRISHSGDNLSDHSPVEIDINLSLSEVKTSRKIVRPCVMWNKLTNDSIELYQQKMSEKLDSITVPSCELLHGDKQCNALSHRSAIESYYRCIVNAVEYADGFLPKTIPALQRSFWSESLNDLKQKSIACCKFWKSNGMPKSGPIFDCKRSCTGNYKMAIRKAKKTQDSNVNDALHNNLCDQESNEFWKTWRNCNKADDSLVTRVDGVTSEKSIADAFAAHFKRVYSGSDSPAHQSLKSEFEAKFSDYCLNHSDYSLSPYYFSWSNMVDIVSKLKTGKSSSGDIKPEHVLYGSITLLIHLHLLFNALLQHGFVVSDFLQGIITPIVKDTQGDLSDCSNYRGITIGCLFSKMFEIGLDGKCLPFLSSDNLQFGFKKKTSTSHALFVLKSTVDHFTENRSNVYAAFLDCTKAFDRISHHGLFIKLMEREVPLVYLLVIIYWHLSMICRVKWSNEYSENFSVPLGTKQGGVMSPRFFAVYIDDMIILLRKCGVGCYLIDLFIGCILFADDLALLAPSRTALQKLITICESYCSKFCLTFNAKKSKIMIFGRADFTNVKPLHLNNANVDFITEWKYLGTTVTSGKSLSFSARTDISAFYRAANSVLNVLTDAQENILMSLLYTNCIPIISYACSVKTYSSSDMTDCNTAINSVVRKIFGFEQRQSVRFLREISGYKSIYNIFAEAQKKFLTLAECHINPVIKHLALLNVE